jgi:hypothetical protein
MPGLPPNVRISWAALTILPGTVMSKLSKPENKSMCHQYVFSEFICVFQDPSWYMLVLRCWIIISAGSQVSQQFRDRCRPVRRMRRHECTWRRYCVLKGVLGRPGQWWFVRKEMLHHPLERRMRLMISHKNGKRFDRSASALADAVRHGTSRSWAVSDQAPALSDCH